MGKSPLRSLMVGGVWGMRKRGAKAGKVERALWAVLADHVA